MISGIVIQVYRAKIPGATHQDRLDWCARRLDEAVTIGVSGIAWHGFSSELTPDVFSPLASLCKQRNLAAYAAFGMDSDDPTGKGRRIGAVAMMLECSGVVLDAEGKWEDEAPRVEAKHSLDLRLALRDAAPIAFIADQPWPVPTLHWSVFPWEEFSRCVDAHAPQWYWVDWRKQFGDRAYARCDDWFEGSWHKLETMRLGPKGLIRPRFPTIQGYGQRDVDVLDCLAKHPTVMVWAEPWPEATTLSAIKSFYQQRCVGA